MSSNSGAAVVPLPPWAKNNGVATQFTRNEAQAFARSILSSEAYRSKLRARAEAGALPPAVEAMLWYYAYGKPIEQVQLNVTQEEDLSMLTLEQLRERAAKLEEQLEEAEAVASAIPADVLKGPW